MPKDQPENNNQKIETVHVLPSWANKKPKHTAVDVNLVDETEKILNTTQQTISVAKKTIDKFAQAGSASGAFFNNSDDKKIAYETAKSALGNAEEKINSLSNEFGNNLAQRSSVGLGNGSITSNEEDEIVTNIVSA